jgi:hypothetical protein
VLAEGLNLQDCAHVVSYDLPWNPVRLIQRIGRIDRMGSPHERVHAYNFVPDRQLDSYLSLLHRLRVKLHAIDLAVGLEHIVIARDGSSDAGWDHLTALRSTRVQTSADEELRTWLRAKQCAGSAADCSVSANVPCMTIIRRDRHGNGGDPGRPPRGAGREPTVIVVASETGTCVRAYRACAGKIEEVDLADVVRTCMHAAAPGDLSATDQQFLADIARRAYVQVSRTLTKPLQPLSAHVGRFAAAPRLSMHLRAALCSLPGGPDASQVKRAEDLIHALRRGHSVAAQTELLRLSLDAHASFDDLASSIDAVTRAAPTPPGPATAGSEWRFICAVFDEPRG